MGFNSAFKGLKMEGIRFYFFYMTILGLPDPEDRGTMILQNIWKYSSTLEMSQPRGLQSSVTMLQK
jgi:hypothetical protein